MYDMNLRGKAIKNFARDVTFLRAILTGQTTFQGIIMEKKPRSNNWMKIKLYVPEWNRMISTTYPMISENCVQSRDEKSEIDVTLYRNVTIQCAIVLHNRNWKERIVFHIA
jgi:hypothetical protein